MAYTDMEAKRRNAREYAHRRRRTDPKRVAEIHRRAQLKLRYGITPEQYDELLEQQSCVCAICEGTNPSGHRLAVDHDHITGAVRGLLCHACNAGVGKLRDDPGLLRAAATYLEEYV